MSHLSLLGILAAPAAVLLALTVYIALRYRRIGPHQALVVSGPKGVRVFLQGGAVVPPLSQAEVMDLSTHTLSLELTGARSLRCKNYLRADLRARFLLRVNSTREDVEKVARTVGAARASSPEVLRELFEAKFREALRTTLQSADFEDWLTHQEELRDHATRLIGRELGGFFLDDLQLEEYAATPHSFYDSNDILDAHGLRLIIERTTQAQLARNEMESRARMEAMRLQVEADEAYSRLEQEKALREAELQGAPPAHGSKSALDAHIAAVRAQAAETEAAFKRAREKTQTDGRGSGSGDGGGASGGASGPGFQAGLRKT